MASLADYRQDISSLESEILQLERQLAEHVKELEKVREENYSNGGSAAEKQRQKQKQTDVVTPPREHFTSPYDDILIPPPAEHEFFDGSINDFFKSGNIEIGHPDKRAKIQNNQDDIPELEKREILSHINMENLYRLNGVTAFAINDASINSSTNYKDLKQLGIRFDLFEETQCQFKKPHYIILNKNEKNDNWEVFKKTIPEYIELDLKWLNLDLYKFTSEIRKQLIKASEVDELSRPANSSGV